MFILPSDQTADRNVDLPSATCYDTLTLLSLPIPLAAPPNSNVISPLSTLMVFRPQGVSVSDMELAIKAGFGIPYRLRIGLTDAYVQYANHLPGSFNLVLAEQLVGSVVIQTSYLLVNGTTVGDIAKTVFRSVALIAWTQYEIGSPVNNLISILNRMNSVGRRRLRSNLDLEFNNSTIQLNFDNVTVDLLITLTLYLLNETSTPSQALEPEVQAAAAQSIAAITQLYDTANSSTLLNQISTASQSWMSDLLRALGNSRVGVDEFKAQSSKESIAAQVGAINPPFDDDHQASISGLSIGSPAFVGMVASVATLSLAVVAIGVWLRTRQRRSTEVRRAPAVLNQLNIMDRAWSALPTPPRPMVQHIQASPTRARHTATLTPDFDAPPPRKSAARRLTQI